MDEIFFDKISQNELVEVGRKRGKCKDGGMQGWEDARRLRCKEGGMPGEWDARMVGCKERGIQGGWDAIVIANERDQKNVLEHIVVFEYDVDKRVVRERPAKKSVDCKVEVDE